MIPYKKFCFKFLFLVFVVLLFSYVSAIRCGPGFILEEEQHLPKGGVELVFVQQGDGCGSKVVLKNEGTQTAHDVQTTIWVENQQFTGINLDLIEPEVIRPAGGMLNDLFREHKTDSIRVTVTSKEGATAEAIIKRGLDTNRLLVTIFFVLFFVMPILSIILYKFSKNKDLWVVVFVLWLLLIGMGLISLLIQ